jgi:hypothetical protein
MKTTPLKTKIEFFSPINLENSFTNKNLSKNTKSEMDITINEDGTGFVEWEVEELDLVEGIGLCFEGNELTDYDGVFELPKQLIDFLTEKGYNMDWAKV